MKIKYEMGDWVYLNESIFLYKIIDVSNDRILLEFQKLDGKMDAVWVNANDIEGFAEGTTKYLDHKIQELVEMYMYESVLENLNKYKTTK